MKLSEKWTEMSLSRVQKGCHSEFTIVVGVADNSALRGLQEVAISAPTVAVKKMTKTGEVEQQDLRLS